MNPDELFSILNTYEGFTLTLWNFYIAVILGLLAYAIGSEKAQEWPVRVVLVIAFCAFAWGNLNYIERNQVLITALAKEVDTEVRELEVSEQLAIAISSWASMQPPSMKKLHISIDVGVVFLLLFGPTIANAFRSRSTKN